MIQVLDAAGANRPTPITLILNFPCRIEGSFGPVPGRSLIGVNRFAPCRIPEAAARVAVASLGASVERLVQWC